jgi:hypothetical protein
MRAVFLICTLMLKLFIAQYAFARFATFNEADAQIDIYNISVNIDKSGNCEILQEVQLKILNESGREQLASQSFIYNSGNEAIEIIEARSIQDGKIYKVEGNMIQDKTLAGGENGFDDMNRIQIAYPNVGVGSSIYYRIKINRKEPIFDGFYEALYSPGASGYYVKSYNLNVKSKMKLHYAVNDPFKKLEVDYTEKNGLHILKATLTNPLIEKLVFENGFLTSKQKTFIQMTTIESYEQFVRNMAPQYEKVIKASMPQVLDDIAQAAQQIVDQHDQINFVTSRIADKIRYMGDWRTVKGKVFPRSFDEVVSSGYGDCKDFASMTVAILRKLGYRAFPSFVYRGEGAFYEKSEIVETLMFNHVIAQVIGKDGAILWIDPTNFVSFATGIFPDIASRPALVLNESHPALVMIPEINYKTAAYRNKSQISLNKDGDSVNSGKFTFEGEAAIPYTGSMLIYSEQELKEKLLYALSGEMSPQNINIILPDMKSRIVQNFAIEYSYKIANASYQTNLGSAYAMDSSWPSTYLELPDDQVGVAYVGYPKTITSTIYFSNIFVKNPEMLNAEIKTKWFEAMRECKKENKMIVCIKKVAILQSFITPSDISSLSFIEAKGKLKKHFVSSALIYESMRSPSSHSTY